MSKIYLKIKIYNILISFLGLKNPIISRLRVLLDK